MNIYILIIPLLVFFLVVWGVPKLGRWAKIKNLKRAEEKRKAEILKEITEALKECGIEIPLRASETPQKSIITSDIG